MEEGIRKQAITKDHVLIGPPLGGAVCFTVQATEVVYQPTGLTSPLSILIALTVGATAGWLIELAISKTISAARGKERDPDGN